MSGIDYTVRGSYSSLSISSAREVVPPQIIFPLAANRNLFEKDSQCIICECKFYVKGISHTKKQECLFCYRGVCIKCSSFYYYHSETKLMEAMCSSCHDKLISMSEDFSNEVKQYRLEKIQLKQEIDLAIKQKNQFTEERKKLELDLERNRSNYSLSTDEKDKILSNLKKEQTMLLEARAKAQMRNAVEASAHSSAHFQYENSKKNLEDLKLKYKENLDIISKLKEDYSSTQDLKIKVINKKEEVENFDFNTKSQVIQSLIQEINRLQDAIDEKMNKIELSKSLLIDEEQTKIEHQSTIDKMKKIFEINEVNNAEEYLTNEEKVKIDELQKQLDDINSIIVILEQRLNITKEKNQNESTRKSVNIKPPKKSKEGPRYGEQICKRCEIY